jgi:hypothetical protein
LKALGCASIRDGTYLLPHEHAGLFEPLVEEVRANGGQASVMQLSPSDEGQGAELRGLFDRSEAYGQWRTEADTFAASLAALGEVQARRRLRGVAESLQALRPIDYYPGNAAEQAESHLIRLRQAVDTMFSKGEPMARAPHGIPRLDLRKHQGKRGRGPGWIAWPAPG